MDDAVTEPSTPRAGSTFRIVRVLFVPLTVVLLLVALVPAAEAKRRVPKGFIGTMLDGPLIEPGFTYGGELDVMVKSGVESIRSAFYWSDAQPYGRFEDVPQAERSRYRNVDGVPTDFRQLDRMVTGTAKRRIRVLPVIVRAPAWAAKYPGAQSSPPSNRAAYARFAKALVLRYGPRGSFWREHPGIKPLPIRRWQLWNEPNLRYFWTDQPFTVGYVPLLRSAHSAIKRADPGAKVILGGIFGFAEKYLAQIYRAGGRRYFDGVAIHPFTRRPRGIITILRRVRRVMRTYGDRRKALQITEFTWPSAKGKTSRVFGWEQTERGQAARIRETFSLLLRYRRSLRLTGVYYYTWLTRDRIVEQDRVLGTADSFRWAGLRRLQRDGSIVSKPALRTFRRTALRLEGCASKNRIASRCHVRARG
jgi:hypothetical protein